MHAAVAGPGPGTPDVDEVGRGREIYGVPDGVQEPVYRY